MRFFTRYFILKKIYISIAIYSITAAKLLLLFMKISFIASYKVIAVCSFLILCGVQFFLVYNTYTLKDEHYFLSEKQTIRDDYMQCIRNDKLFPGGAAIIDSFIYANMPKLELLHQQRPVEFAGYSKQLSAAVIGALRKANNMDSVLAAITQRHQLKQSLHYALTLDLLDITFESNKYITLYNSKMPAAADTVTPHGVLIGGGLKDLNAQNMVTSITVSSPVNRSYRTTFTLYVDSRKRKLVILRQMMPTLVLSLLSVLSVVFLFYITFRNWIKQKKIAEMKTDFINSINHEFHTPLAAIMVANKNLQNKRITDSRENIGPLTDVIARQSERLKTLIEQVIDITRINTIQLSKKQYSLHLLLDEILLDYHLKLNDPGIQLTLQKEAGNDSVWLDQFWFTTMLLNIFDNAVKYNNSKQKEITVSTHSDKKKLQLVIRDNGIGMSSETQKQVFEKFYRNAGILKHSKGLGLGLYYVKLCVDTHHWDIFIESEPDKGSRFIIHIPF